MGSAVAHRIYPSLLAVAACLFFIELLSQPNQSEHPRSSKAWRPWHRMHSACAGPSWCLTARCEPSLCAPIAPTFVTHNEKPIPKRPLRRSARQNRRLASCHQPSRAALTQRLLILLEKEWSIPSASLGTLGCPHTLQPNCPS